MEAYLDKLLSQIRCKKARPYIEEEIRSHIESQTEDNIAAGMSPEDAEKSAVLDMGNPIETGISLDKIHRPQIAWKLLIIVGILSLLGILIQQSILHQAAYKDLEASLQATYRLNTEEFVSSVIIGFILMCIIYFIDYTAIAKYSKIIGLFIITMGVLLLTGFWGNEINGVRYSIGFGICRISATSLMMFYVPIYGAILYKYRDGGISALIRAILWLIAPVLITLRLPNMTVAGIIMISMLIQLTVSIVKGWFRIPVKRAVISLWAVFMLLPVVSLFIMYTFHLLATYQEARIRSFITASGDAFYLPSLLRTLSNDILLVGNSSNEIFGHLPNLNSDYVFSYILNSYGSIAGIIIVAILALLVMFIFASGVKQKNELGMVMGFGCGMIFALNIVINLLSSVGIIPPASSFLPFFSIGKSNILLCYAMLGIIMSIYRYKDIYPKKIKLSNPHLT